MNQVELRDFLNTRFNESELRDLCFTLGIDYEALPGDGRSNKARELVAYCGRHSRLDELSAECLRLRPTPNGSAPTPTPPTILEATKAARVFISYKRHSGPDNALAQSLYTSLSASGHTVFIDTTLRVGAAWLEQIDAQIKSSDFLIVLLSRASVDSEMVRSEVQRAAEYRRLQGRPQVLPVRLAYDGQLPYSISAFLNPLQYIVWRSAADDARVLAEIASAIQGKLPDQPVFPPLTATASSGVTEDGRAVSDSAQLHPPLPEFDARVLEALETPGGTVKLSDALYVRRASDDALKREVSKTGTTTIIRAARQTGKSSLLIRGIQLGRERNAKIVYVDLQTIDASRLGSPDLSLRDLGDYFVRKLRLDVDVAKHWGGSLPPQEKLTSLLEETILPAVDGPIIFAMDEADRFLGTPMSKDFFGLVRAWHNNRATSADWNKFNIVLVISTEPYLLINDVNHSPFNVGITLYLDDFNAAQTADLNRRHGSPIAEGDLSQAQALLGGHPYLTRMALYTLSTDGLTWRNLADVASREQGPFGDHLRRYYWLLRNEAGLRDALRQVIREHRCKDDLAFFRLLQAGLVKGSGDVAQPRCGLYEAYFKERL